ncbi:MAG: tetratricopeptide repeat protein [Deltaproteobacteria bacterium]|nr:tetratricopeptide repeat protein [Deltaproteobacteria bacterium]MBW2137095.1 tetratricopeptide repeat protein [Deltaproteobacteria bacterium]
MWQQIWGWILDPNNPSFLISVALAFVIGTLVGLRMRSPREPKFKPMSPGEDQSFLRGIRYILSNDHDHAIEEFTKSVQVNSDTVETYVALGNLYRSKGEIDRAIRIRQSIILRANIDEQIRMRALFDLGLDYRKGGFLDRALDTFSKVLEENPADVEALEEIEKIYEEMKDWSNAYGTRKKIARLTGGDHGHILAHHQTELGKMYVEKGETSKAKGCFNKALSIDERCIDAYLHLGDLHFAEGDYEGAINRWKGIVDVAPQFTFLAYRRLEDVYLRMKDFGIIEDFLKECARSNSDPFTHMALARYLYNKEDYEGALQELRNALELDPGFWEARKFMVEILLRKGQKEEALAVYGAILSGLSVPYLKFRCRNCGFRPADLQWQCPQCRKWDSIDFVGRIEEPQLPSPLPDQEAKKR